MYKVTVTNTDNDERFTTTGESVIVISTNKQTRPTSAGAFERY